METQRTALFAFCRRIVADAQRKEIVIETDLLGLAQNETPPGLPAGLCINRLPEGGSRLDARPDADGLLCNSDLPADGSRLNAHQDFVALLSPVLIYRAA